MHEFISSCVICRHHEGVFVLGVQPGSPAEQTHRLCSGDRLLEINGVDTKRATVDVVAQLLTEASENVRLVVGRMHGSISKSEFGSSEFCVCSVHVCQ